MTGSGYEHPMTRPARVRRWRLSDQPPFRRRVLRALLAYAFVMVALVALGLSPSPILLAAFFVAGGAVAAFCTEHVADSVGDAWTATRPSTVGLGRGADHKTVALGRRLAARSNEPGQRAHLAAELHDQLRAVLADQVRRERGRDILREPGAARDVLPPDLADLVEGPPDPRLVDARYLSALLDRIESP